jgi:DNA-binding NtrC family response regulator
MVEKILIVDDEELIRESLSFFLTKEGYRVSDAANGRIALDLIREDPFDLVLTDLEMPEMKGIELLENIGRMSPETLVVIITAYGSIDTAIAALRKGAVDYILKPVEFDELLLKVKRLLASRTLSLENKLLRNELHRQYDFEKIIGQSPAMQRIFEVIRKVAMTDGTVLIHGRSGTGKELVAKAIHFSGARKLRPFVAESCAAIPPTLLESILFGHVRGAFTGANKDAPGLFVEADKGTLFLDEVGELPQELQVKLLRVLQEGEVRPVGGSRTIRVDVRVVTATNQDLARLVKEKMFRDDLYYRLHVMEVRLPPLRERAEDIPILVDHFVAKHGGERQIRVEAAALEALAAYHWPGNVRQLENEIVRALVLCEGVLGVEHLSDAVAQASTTSGIELVDLGMERQLGLLQRRLVRAALDRSGGNRTKAAELLGVSRFGLQKMLARMGE